MVRAAPVSPVETGSTGVAAQVSTASREAAAAAPADLDRVARIRAAIRNGTFPIYPAQVADRLIALKLEWNPHADADARAE